MLDYYKGMDISFLQEYMEKGMKTYDLDGTPTDPLELAKKHGVNAMRLRIWHTPENVPESGGYCSLERTIAMAKRSNRRALISCLIFITQTGGQIQVSRESQWHGKIFMGQNLKKLCIRTQKRCCAR